MPQPVIVGCISQKGGVGKSTIARLLATAYAINEWDVKIADLNVKQKTSVNWVADRMANEVAPEIAAEPFASVKNALRHGERHEMIIFDGAPDSHQTTLDIARAAIACIVPTGVSKDDLDPQINLAHELTRRHDVPVDRILFVLNKTLESEASVAGAADYIRRAGYQVAEHHLAAKTGYQLAQNIGRSVIETAYKPLNDAADRLAQELVDFVGHRIEESI